MNSKTTITFSTLVVALLSASGPALGNQQVMRANAEASGLIGSGSGLGGSGHTGFVSSGHTGFVSSGHTGFVSSGHTGFVGHVSHTGFVSHTGYSSYSSYSRLQRLQRLQRLRLPPPLPPPRLLRTPQTLEQLNIKKRSTHFLFYEFSGMCKMCSIMSSDKKVMTTYDL